MKTAFFVLFTAIALLAQVRSRQHSALCKWRDSAAVRSTPPTRPAPPRVFPVP
jgi:hypothetical protein